MVVPLTEGVIERVRELVSGGPSFDPADTAVTRHCPSCISFLRPAPEVVGPQKTCG